MSVDYGVQLVKWPQFKALWKKHQNERFYYEAEDTGADWLMNPKKVRGWNPSWNFAIDFSNTYRKLRQHVDPAEREKFESFFLKFCLADDKDRWVPLRDLGEDIGEQIFFSTISPVSARRYLELWETIDMEKLRGAYEKSPGDPHRHMRTFKAFKAYPKLWAEILRDAVAQKAGIVITLA